jgi:hypothetical protein
MCGPAEIDKTTPEPAAAAGPQAKPGRCPGGGVRPCVVVAARCPPGFLFVSGREIWDRVIRQGWIDIIATFVIVDCDGCLVRVLMMVMGVR